MRRIPSTQTLRAIESFARHGKVWQVAEELNLTRSAVSHQLHMLENDLGFQILQRVGNSIELTQRGHAYAMDMRKALNIITSSAVSNASDGISGLITVSCAPGFATSWLCVNIGRFIEVYPDITVKLLTPPRARDISNPNVDIFIAFGNDFSKNADIQLLRRVELTPLCSPEYLNRFGGFSDIVDLKQATLLHLENNKEWEEWYSIAGHPINVTQRSITFSDINLVYSAAIASQGVSMGDEFVYKDAMKKGQLIRPFNISLTCEDAYYLAIPHGKSLTPAHHAFMDWIKDEIMG